MEHQRRSNILIEFIAALLILLFIYTGVTKLSEGNHFQIVLSRSPLIGHYSAIISKVLPAVELITAFLLLLPILRKWGLIVSLILMIVFTAYISYMILFTPNLPCSCGGVLKQMTWRQHLLFNIFFTGLTVWGLWIHQRNKILVAISRRSRTPV